MAGTSRSRVRIMLALLASLAVGTGAWTVQHHNSRPRTMHADNYRQKEAYWWNNGSCHGYPDVMDVWAVERDASGALVTSMYDGQTSGQDSCGTDHPGNYPIAAADAWCACEMISPVLGNPNGSEPGHP